jgi:hypothetical protein
MEMMAFIDQQKLAKASIAFTPVEVDLFSSYPY